MIRITVPSAFALLALLLTSCPGPKKPQPDHSDRAPYVAAFADCAFATAKEFKVTADALAAATAAHATAPTAQTLADARAAFNAAMDSWQVNEVLGFGPAAPSVEPGGANLRDEIYSWPLVSRCAVEEEIVAKGYEAGASSLLLNRRGLAAIEYLLFYEGADTACSSTNAIVTSGSWSALGATERDARKRAYAAKAAEDVAARAGQLVTAWDPSGGNFLEKMKTAGPGNELFPTTQRALNVVSDAMFYVDDELKHMKLEAPLGLRDCTAPAASCPVPAPEKLESQYANRSRLNVEANLRGFRKLFYGCGASDAGLGFEDLLLSLGQGSVVEGVKAGEDPTNAALAAIALEDFKTVLVSDTPRVKAVHTGLNEMNRVLKVDMLGVLDLELPMSLEGDND